MDSKTVGLFRSWNHFNEVIIYYQRKTPVFCLLAISVIEVDLVFDSFKKLELISSLRLKARTQQKLEIELVTSITILSLPFLFWRWKVFPARPVRWHPDPSLDHGGPGWSKLTLEKDYNPSIVFQVLSSCPPVLPSARPAPLILDILSSITIWWWDLTIHWSPLRQDESQATHLRKFNVMNTPSSDAGREGEGRTGSVVVFWYFRSRV